MATTARRGRRPKDNADTAAKPRKARKALPAAKGATQEAPVEASAPPAAGAPASRLAPTAPVMRVIDLPPDIWAGVRKLGDAAGEAARYVITRALDAELADLVTRLQQIGFRGEILTKSVLACLDQGIVDRLNAAREQCGIPGITLMRISLEQFLAKGRDVTAH